MNLPFVVDIAIGLIFVYLTLSLLASEIQELITTLLQWRAEHLKNSIQVLLASGRVSPNTQEIKQITEKIYNHPLICSLNQEAKGTAALYFRKIANFFVSLYYRITGGENPFKNNSSAPSYIPAEAFASTIIDTFKIPEMGRLITLARLEDFKQQQLKDILKVIKVVELSESAKTVMNRELEWLKQDWERSIKDFRDGLVSLPETLDLFHQILETYINNCQLYVEQPEDFLNVFIYRLQYLKDRTYGETERKVLLQSLKPKIDEVVEFIRNKPQMLDRLEMAIEDKNSPTYVGLRNIAESLPDLPEPVQKSLSALGYRIKSQKENLEDEISDLQLQIENWFDSSMTRASGVYKRNARGIAVLVGMAIAVGVNADTLYIARSLSRSSVLRAAITENATQFVSSDRRPSAEEFKALTEEVKDSLDEASMPLGWRSSILSEQKQANLGWPIPYLKRAIGWAISGFAISMGAKFWYDLLGKVVSVRNSGGGSSSRR